MTARLEFTDEIRVARRLRSIANASVSHVEKIIERLEKRHDRIPNEGTIAYYRGLLSTYRVLAEEADMMVTKMQSERRRPRPK